MIPILLKSLALTLAAELLTAAVIGLRSQEELRVVTLMNLATNPPAVFCITLARKFCPPGPASALFWGIEVLVWLAETALLCKGAGLNRNRAAVCSLALNGASCALGILLSNL